MIEQLAVHEIPVGTEPGVGAVLGQLDVAGIERLVEGDAIGLEVQPAARVEDAAERMVPQTRAGNVERRNRICRRGHRHRNSRASAYDKTFRLNTGLPL